MDRTFLLFLLLIELYFMTNLVLGWGNISVVLLNEGYYSDICAPNSTIHECTNQRVAKLHNVYVAGSNGWAGLALLSGYVLDRHGCFATRMLGFCILIIGVICLLYAEPNESEILLYPGWFCLQSSSQCLVIASMTMARLFDEDSFISKSFVVILLSGVQIAAAGTSVIIRILAEIMLYKKTLICYGIICSTFILLRSIFFSPKNNIPWPRPTTFTMMTFADWILKNKSDVNEDKDEEIKNKSEASEENDEGTTNHSMLLPDPSVTENNSQLPFLSTQILFSPEFVIFQLTSFMQGATWSFTFSSIHAVTTEKGFGKDTIGHWALYQYAGFGFIILYAVIVQKLAQKQSIKMHLSTIYLFLNTIIITGLTSIQFNNLLGVHIYYFCVSIFQIILMSFNHYYLLSLFPYYHYGKLMGIYGFSVFADNCFTIPLVHLSLAYSYTTCLRFLIILQLLTTILPITLFIRRNLVHDI